MTDPGDINPYKAKYIADKLAGAKPSDNGGGARAAPPPSRHRLRDVSEYLDEEEEDRLRIPRDMIPDGFDFQWVANRIYGQPQPQNRARFERKGWVPVLQDDFEGRFKGRWMGQDSLGEIEVDGLVLMARPMVFTLRARELDAKRARERVVAKEAQLRSGQMPGVSMDTQHESLRGVNKVNRSNEPIRISDIADR